MMAGEQKSKPNVRTATTRASDPLSSSNVFIDKQCVMGDSQLYLVEFSRTHCSVAFSPLVPASDPALIQHVRSNSRTQESILWRSQRWKMTLGVQTSSRIDSNAAKFDDSLLARSLKARQ